MTTSEIVRVVIIIVLLVFLVAWRGGLKERWKESKQKRRQEEEDKAKVEAKTAARAKAQRQEAARVRRTSQILKLDLEGLEQKSVEVTGRRLWYLEGGIANPGATVLLLHGFAGQKEDWNAFSAPLLHRRLHVVAPDLPGFGQNDKVEDQNYEVTAQAKWIRAFVKALDLGRFHLVGSSLGGAIAAAYCYAAPDQVSSLALIEPFGVRVPYESELDRYLSRGINPLTVATPEAFDNLLAFLHETVPAIPEPVRRHRAREAVLHRDFYLKMWPSIRGGERAHLLDLLLPEIKKNVLVIQGQKSQVIHPATVEAVKTMVRDAASVVIPDCGHLPAVERPEETARHFLRFIGADATSRTVGTA